MEHNKSIYWYQCPRCRVMVVLVMLFILAMGALTFGIVISI